MFNEFSAAELRRRFATAFPPRPAIYWCDLLISAGIGWGAFAIGVGAPFGASTHVAATAIATVALLRAAIFIHELAHLRDEALSGFAIVWHLLVGFPLLLPSLMYVGSHNDHHRQPTFGTVVDPEYAPIAHWSRFHIARFVFGLIFVPFLLVLRWGVLGPLSFFMPALRRVLIARASTLVINPDYRRPPPRKRQAARWVIQEIGVAMTCWGMLVSTCLGWLSPWWMMQWYLVMLGMLLINQVRTLAAHRYDNDGARLDAAGQLLDSVTLNGRTLPTVLAAPLGLRFHALHHLLPTVPYHALGAVHRLLLAELPSDSPYVRTQARGIVAAVRALLRRAEADAATLSVDRAARGA